MLCRTLNTRYSARAQLHLAQVAQHILRANNGDLQSILSIAFVGLGD